VNGSSPSAPEFSVCVATRNRVEALVACLNSLTRLGDRRFEVLVLDDASDPPAEPACRPRLDPAVADRVRFFRHEVNTGYIVARNELARAAAGPVIFSLDDDAEVLDTTPLAGLDVLARDPTVGAVGFPQVGADGTPYPDYMQPAPGGRRCLVPTFYGHGHLLRREVFLRLGGYRDRFWAYGEEKEYCKRLWDAGYRVVYLPDVPIRHVHSPTGRSTLTWLRYGTRNAILDSVYNEPLPLPLVSIPYRLVSYWWGRRALAAQYGLSDPGGLWWQLRELVRNLPAALRDRRPIRHRTARLWRRLRATHPVYDPPDGGAV
jgi:GT2 family glycosyltransferase